MAALDISNEVFDRTVRQGMAALLADGYVISNAAMRETAALGPYLEAVVLSRSRGRKVTVSFLPAVSGAPESLSVLVHSKGDSFSVDRYLRYCGASAEEQAKLRLTSYDGALDERIAKVLVAVIAIFQASLSTVIFESSWVDIPIDWGNHK